MPGPEEAQHRWPALLAVLTAAGLYAVLPASLAIGPSWLLPSVAGVLAAATVITHSGGRHRANVALGHAQSAVLTVFMLSSVVRLVVALPAHSEPPAVLLRSAAALWVTNVLVFALWYWRLDAGGPHARDQRNGHETGAFLFPQMTLDGAAGDEADGSPWSPRFIDYLFLAFNTSTAFSPTDAPVLSRWAKGLLMVQSTISLAVIAVLVGRAVNIM